jgi:mRNA interferase RelE/StbE
MSYSIEYESEALADLEKLPPDIRKRIVNKIEWLAQNFEQIIPQSLTGDWAGFYKLRVGNYRIIYQIDLSEKIIMIDVVGHRREIYD